MAPVIFWTLLALVVALLVLVLGGLAHAGTRGVGTFLTDLRGGLRRLRRNERHTDEEQLVEVQDASVKDIFSFGHDGRPAYVGADDLTPMVQRALLATERHGRQLSRQLSRQRELGEPAATSDAQQRSGARDPGAQLEPDAQTASEAPAGRRAQH